jgi:predicted metal-dependent hydrolase
MTDLQVRKMRFAFADSHVPFLWNESNPAFSSMANAVSFLAIAFEKMIGAMISEAMPLITDPEVRAEAEAFVRQEGQHSMAHRQHAKGLITSYPGLKETLDEVIGAFDDLTANTPLKYRLAYTADLEATFTPVFKLMLDHDDTLFAPGDDRVASLFLWHFVEEVEHRSSALIIYDAVVVDPWYRMRMVPSIFKHVWVVLQRCCEGFNEHVPVSERKVDALSMFGMQARRKALLQRIPFIDVPDDGPFENAFTHLPKREMLTALTGVVRSQIPGHNPTHEKLPALAGEWFDRYNDGADCTLWYSAAGRRTTRNEAVGVPPSDEETANV